MQAHLKWDRGSGVYEIVSGDRRLILDENSPRPMQLLLMSIMSCTAMDVVHILSRMRVPFEKVEVEAHGERAPEHPKVFTKISLIYRVHLPEPEKYRKKVEKAVNLSKNKFCSASANVNARYDYEIVLIDTGSQKAQGT